MVATAVFDLFSCDDVPGYPRAFLRLDYHIQCQSNEWWFFLVLGIVVGGLFVVGLPWYLLEKTRKSRVRLIQDARTLNRHYLKWFGSQPRQGWSKGGIETAQKQSDNDLPIPLEGLSKVMSAARGGCCTGQSIETDTPTTESEIAAWSEELTRYTESREDWHSWEFFWGDYLRRYFFWDVVEMSERLVMTSVIVIIVQFSPDLNILLGCLFSIGFLIIQSTFFPYEDTLFNFINSSMGIAQFLTLFGFLALSFDNPDVNQYRSAIDLTIVFANIFVFGLIVMGNGREVVNLVAALGREWDHRINKIPRSHYETESKKLLERFLAITRISILLKRRIRERRSAGWKPAPCLEPPPLVLTQLELALMKRVGIALDKLQPPERPEPLLSAGALATVPRGFEVPEDNDPIRKKLMAVYQSPITEEDHVGARWGDITDLAARMGWAVSDTSTSLPAVITPPPLAAPPEPSPPDLVYVPPGHVDRASPQLRADTPESKATEESSPTNVRDSNVTPALMRRLWAGAIVSAANSTSTSVARPQPVFRPPERVGELEEEVEEWNRRQEIEKATKRKVGKLKYEAGFYQRDEL